MRPLLFLLLLIPSCDCCVVAQEVTTTQLRDNILDRINDRFDAEFRNDERRFGELLKAIAETRDENRRLREDVKGLRDENNTLFQRIRNAGDRIEEARNNLASVRDTIQQREGLLVTFAKRLFWMACFLSAAVLILFFTGLFLYARLKKAIGI